VIVTDILVVCRGFEVWVQTQHLLDQMVTFLLKTFTSTILTGVQTFPITAVDRLRRRGPEKHTITAHCKK
jgi:hypothetical protein